MERKDNARTASIELDGSIHERNGKLDPLLQNQNLPSVSATFAKRGQTSVYWQQPTLMVLSLVCGVVLAVSHHFYYSSLHDTAASSTSTQQWAIRFGTAFAILTQACFKATVVIACVQFGWKIVHSHTLSIESLNQLFDLTNDPFSLFSIELLSKATALLVLALSVWLMPAVAVLTPGTLTVVVDYREEVKPQQLPILNYESMMWEAQSSNDLAPSYHVMRLATQAAMAGDILNIPSPHPNSSYSLRFYGPSLQCTSPDHNETTVFDYFNANLFSNFTANDARTGLLKDVGSDLWINDTQRHAMPDIRMFAAWTTDYAKNTFYSIDGNNSLLSQDSWVIDFPEPYKEADRSETFDIWIQLANESVVCRVHNASYDLLFEYVNGVQTVTPVRIQPLEQFNDDFDSSYGDIDDCIGSTADIRRPKCRGIFGKREAYRSVFAATANMVFGNATMSPFGWLRQTSTSLLLTKLVACDAFSLTKLHDAAFAVAYDRTNHSDIDINDIFPEGRSIENPTTDSWFTDTLQLNYTESVQGVGNWCRNGSLVTSIQDLMHNVTISMLSSPQLTKASSQPIDVTIKVPLIVYDYRPLNLVLAYGCSAFVAAVCLVVGILAFRSNGVSHSRAFSAIVSATRRHELDEIFAGSPIAAHPTAKDILRTRLRFRGRSEHDLADPQSADGFQIVRFTQPDQGD